MRLIPSSSTLTRIATALGIAASPATAQSPQQQQLRPDSAAARLNARALPSAPPRTIDLPRDGASIALQGTRTRPVVLVTIDGHGPYRFIVETGAPFTGITPEVAAAIGAVPSDTANPSVTVRTLTIGDAQLHDFRVAVIGAPTQGIDGLLGLNAYRDLLLTLDYQAGQMRLTRGSLAPANGRDRIALVPSGDLWEFEIVVEGRAAHAVLDTQNGGAFSVTPAGAADLQFMAAPVVTGTARGPGIGVQEIRSGRLAGDIRVGDVIFRTPIVGIVPMPPGYPQGWNMGGPALAAFTMTLDQRARVVQFTRSGRAAVDAPPALGNAGFRATVRPGAGSPSGRVVTDVAKGGAADAAGLHVGDEIVRVDGRPVAELDAESWTARLRRPGALPLVVRRDGSEVELELTIPVVVP